MEHFVLMPSKLWLQVLIFFLLAMELMVGLKILATLRMSRLAKVISIETQLVQTVTAGVDAYVRAHQLPPSPDTIRAYGENLGALTVGVLTRNSDIRLTAPSIEITQDSAGYFVLVKGRSVKDEDISRPLRVNFTSKG